MLGTARSRRSFFMPGAVLVLLFGVLNETGAFSLSNLLRTHPQTPQHPSGSSRSRSRNRISCLGASDETDAYRDDNNDNDDNNNNSSSSSNNNNNHRDRSGYDVFSPTKNRRGFLRDQLVGTGTTLASTAAILGGGAWAADPGAAFASNPKSRTDGYAVQRTEREWSYILSGPQYYILRKGGTERQKSSVLNTFTAEDNVGTYVCAACPTALFASADKFSSGTGWPSFATALPGVEAEALDPVRATLGGREVRCGTCGGHLGDLFNDGWVYVGTKAFGTGNRYCIDGAALVFQPSDGSDAIPGDRPPPNKVINYEPAIFRDKSVNSR